MEFTYKIQFLISHVHVYEEFVANTCTNKPISCQIEIFAIEAAEIYSEIHVSMERNNFVL